MMSWFLLNNKYDFFALGATLIISCRVLFIFMLTVPRSLGTDASSPSALAFSASSIRQHSTRRPSSLRLAAMPLRNGFEASNARHLASDTVTCYWATLPCLWIYDLPTGGHAPSEQSRDPDSTSDSQLASDTVGYKTISTSLRVRLAAMPLRIGFKTLTSRPASI